MGCVSTQEKRIFLKGRSPSLSGLVVFDTESVTAVEYVEKLWEKV